MELTMQEVKNVLTQFKDEMTAKVESLIGEGKSATDGELVALRSRLDEITASLVGVEDTIKKAGTFGLPGLKEEIAANKIDFSWQRFFLAQTMTLKAARYGMSSADAMGKIAPKEKEICVAYAKRRKAQYQDMLLYGADPVEMRDFTAGDGSSGGFLIPPEIYQGDIIDTVYAQTPIIDKMPCMKLTGLMGDLPIPKDLGNLTAYWVGENGKPTATDSSVGLEWLRSKKLGVFSKVSNKLLAYSNTAVDQWIKMKMGRDGSVKLSDGLLNGTGSQYQPRGLLQDVSSMTAGVELGTNGGRFTVDSALSMKQKLAAANELRDTNTYGYLMHPNTYFGMLRERVPQYSGQSAKQGMPVVPGQLILDPNAVQNLLGAVIGHTTQMSAAITRGSSTTNSRVLFGDWSMFVYAQFRDPIFRVSDIAGDGSTGSAFLDDETYLVMFLEVDCALLRKTAMCVISSAETNEANW